MPGWPQPGDVPITSHAAQAFAVAPTPLAIVDAQAPRTVGFLQVNDRFARLFGWTPAEMVGMSMWDLTAAADIAGTDAVIAAVPKTETAEFAIEKRFVRRDGRHFWGVSRTVRLVDDAGEMTFGVVHVEHEPRRAELELELERSRQLTGDVERHGEVGSFELDLADGAFRLSEQACRILGLDPSAPPPSIADFLASVHPEDRRALGAAIAGAGEAVRVQYRIERGGEPPLVIEARLAPAGAAAEAPLRWRSGTLRAVRPAGAPGGEPALAEGLSDREREILHLVADGMTTAEIGLRVGLSPETVKTHLGRTYVKLGAHDRAAAVARALRAGLIR